MNGVIDQVFTLLADGGWVMVPLVLGSLVLWYALGWRLMHLQRGTRETVDNLVAKAFAGEELTGNGVICDAVRIAVGECKNTSAKGPLVPRLEDALFEVRDGTNRFSTLVQSLVIAAPLTGLLGTVGGMIETFDSLATMALFTQSGGIAGGISQALITTQMGLAVAIPGLLFGRVLSGRQLQLLDDVDRVMESCVRTELERKSEGRT